MAEGSVHYLRSEKVASIGKKVIAGKREHELSLFPESIDFQTNRLHAVTVATFRSYRNARY